MAYQTSLHQNKEMMELLIHERGLSHQTIRDFGIGFSGKGTLTGLTQEHKIEFQILGILNEKGNDRNWSRITFPIYNKDGELSGFMGRQTSAGDAKYLLPADNPYLHKSQTLFNLHQAIPYIRQEKFVYMVEGVFDVMSLWQAGIRNVVAPLGTALTPDQLALVSNYTDHFVLAFDGEVAGFKASLRATKMIVEYVSKRKPEWTLKGGVALLKLGENKDLGDYLKIPNELEEVVNQKWTFVDYCKLKAMTDIKYKEAFLDFKKESTAVGIISKTKSSLTATIEQKIDIVEIASRYTDLKKSGRNYMASCTSAGHTDRTPSMMINPSTQRFRCFGCGGYGNVIQLVADAENMTYIEARTKLKNEYGIKGFDHIKSESNPFYSANKQAVLDYVVNAFNYTLTSSAPEAVKYMTFLEKHGIVQEQVAEFKIGLAPPDDEALIRALVANGHDLDVACEMDVIRKDSDAYKSNITSCLTIAKSNYGKLIGIDTFKAEEIGQLKVEIEKIKAKQIRTPTKKQVRTV